MAKVLHHTLPGQVNIPGTHRVQQSQMRGVIAFRPPCVPNNRIVEILIGDPEDLEQLHECLITQAAIQDTMKLLVQIAVWLASL